jgi:hypothetical protein
MCLSSTLTHSVEVGVGTWIFFAVASVAYSVMHVATGFNITVLACVWVLIGWLVFLFAIVLENHLIHVRDQFVSDAKIVPLTQEECLPGWTRVDAEHFHRSRLHLFCWFVKGTPNRQHALYWTVVRDQSSTCYCCKSN